MVDRKYHIPLEEIPAIGYIEEDCMLDKYRELKVALEDLDKVEVENIDLKENLKEANECIRKNERENQEIQSKA